MAKKKKFRKNWFGKLLEKRMKTTATPKKERPKLSPKKVLREARY
ncbi:MAG: hypothetical protein ABIG60_00050 [Patescibacteria group bacterium]